VAPRGGRRHPHGSHLHQRDGLVNTGQSLEHPEKSNPSRPRHQCNENIYAHLLLLLFLGSCSCLPNVQYAKKAYGHVVKLGFDSIDLVDTALVEMYRNCGDFDNENELIVRKSVCDLGFWSSLIFEAFQDGNAED